MAYRSGARERAKTYLEKACSHAEGVRLPTIARMAVEAGVGLGTMCRAVRQERDRGGLSVKPGGGVRTRSLPDKPAVYRDPGRSGPGGPRWRRIAGRIEAAIDTGAFDTHPFLPYPKSLCREYQVNYRTLRKALEHLAGRGLLRPRGRSYCAVRWEGARPAGRIVLVAHGSNLGELLLPTFRSRNHLFILESLCARARADLEIITIYMRHGSQVAGLNALDRALSGGRAGAPLLGCMVWTTGIDPAVIRRLMQLLARTACPVGILDELEPPPDLGPYLASGRFRCFSMGHSSAAGEAMGRYLISRGHRRVLYLDYAGAHWSRMRHQGLERAFSRAGLVRGVERLVIGDPSALSAEPPVADPQLRDALFRILGPAAAGRGREHRTTDQRLLEQVGAAVREYAHRRRQREALGQGLDPWLKQEEITALVACNDETALDCLDLLADRDIAVPGRLSVAGFDDGHGASERNLTTYNFNGQAALHALVNHLLSCPPAQRQRPFGGVEEAEGFVVPRRTG